MAELCCRGAFGTGGMFLGNWFHMPMAFPLLGSHLLLSHAQLHALSGSTSTSSRARLASSSLPSRQCEGRAWSTLQELWWLQPEPNNVAHTAGPWVLSMLESQHVWLPPGDGVCMWSQ